jgi:signal transduction histidine kinase
MFAFLHTKKPPSKARDEIFEASLSAEKLRTTLLLAFGGLLSLMLAAGVGALFSLRQLHTIEEEVSGRFMTRTQALSTLVISVHVYDDQLERFLLEDQLTEQSQARFEIASHAAEAHSALRSYPADREPQEQQMLKEIEQALSEQEVTFAALLSRAPEARREHSRQFIHEQLIPRSQDIVQVLQQIALLNTGRLARENQGLLMRFQGLQMRLTSMLILALTAGLLLSIVGSFYILRLERQGRQRYRALAHNRRELEKLSARLVDVQEQERRSISRELHDEVGQTLEALLVDLGRLSTLVPSGEQAIREQITRVKSLAENSVKSVRNIALLLRPSMLDDLGLIPALEWQAREVSRRSEMEVDVYSEMVSEKLPDETRICIYRLVQEALNNAATHSAARNARVSVVQTPGKLRVEITDDGRGFDPLRVRGMGLLGMEERVKRLGGMLSIESRAGQGTSVKAELPLDAAKYS